MLKVIDLFSGIGGLSNGFKMEGFNVILANEIDKEIAYSYQMNNPTVRMINDDITKLNLESVFGSFIGMEDLIVIGGPPCQGFSQKGSRLGLNDERNYLFMYFYRVVDFLKPRYFLMENVPNMLTVENGYFKQQIEKIFGEIGYSLDMDILNANEYGVPQNRRRAFVLGKKGFNKIFLPMRQNYNVTVGDAISDLAYLQSGEGEEIQEYRNNPQSDYQKRLFNDNDKLYNHVATKHSKLALERLSLIPPEKGKECLPKEHLTKSIYSGTWCRLSYDEPSVTITTRFDTPSSGRFTHPFLNRAITVREAARIQSFSDNIRFYGTKTSQMKQVGNAVPPFLSNSIAKVIKGDIG